MRTERWWGAGILAVVLLGLAAGPARAALLYDNGPLVNSPGTGVGGLDESILQTSLSMNTLGFGHQLTSGFRIADDFTIPGGQTWNIDTIVFYAYQTGSGTTSTMTAVNLRIWDGVPDAVGSSVVFGDTTTNRLTGSIFANIYRVQESTSGSDTNRPVMADTVAVGTTLGTGTYWLDWQTDGSTSYSGPWAPPITINGMTTTGDALQYITSWGPALDSGVGAQQGFPFRIYGAVDGTGPGYVPEPATLALLGVGLVGAALRFRRRGAA